MTLNIRMSISGALHLIAFVRLVSSQAECFRRISGGIEQFCCDNYVKKNGVCVECEAGTKSKNEEPCIPCNQGTYGRKCRRLCKCKLNERCDKISGCVLRNKFVTLKDIYGQILKISTNKQTYGNTTSYFQHTRTVISHNATTRFTKEHFTKSEMIVYSVGASGIILITTLVCFVFVWLYKNKSKNSDNIRISSQDSTERNANDQEGSLYDSINEDEIYDDNIQIRYCQDSTVVVNSSDSERSSLTSESSGYLHAYTSVTKQIETHAYCEQINSYDRRSSSSIIDRMKKNSEYTHTYQQMEDVKTIETKSEYSKLVQYLELIDITVPSSVSESLSNKTISSSLRLNDQKEYDVDVLCPVLNSPCLMTKNNIPSCQPLDFKFHPVRYFSSFPTFDQRENTGVDNEKLSNVKRMSV